jgi:hypothetical protein
VPPSSARERKTKAKKEKKKYRIRIMEGKITAKGKDRGLEGKTKPLLFCYV